MTIEVEVRRITSALMRIKPKRSDSALRFVRTPITLWMLKVANKFTIQFVDLIRIIRKDKVSE